MVLLDILVRKPTCFYILFFILCASSLWCLFQFPKKYLCLHSGKKIQMTSPVVVKIPDKRFWQMGIYTMSFLLPTEHQENPPKPTNSDVCFLNKKKSGKYLIGNSLMTDSFIMVCRCTSLTLQIWKCMRIATEDGWRPFLTAVMLMTWVKLLIQLKQNTKKDPTVLLDTTGKVISIIRRKTCERTHQKQFKLLSWLF